MTFIDDSPPLQTWGANNTVVESTEESDRSSGRAVLGTAAGDLYIFIQRGVRLIPREVLEHCCTYMRPKTLFPYVQICASAAQVSYVRCTPAIVLLCLIPQKKIAFILCRS